MSKAYLIMDMPSSCDVCEFAKESRIFDGDLYCNNPLATLQGNYVTDYVKCRPIWCPLCELPQKYYEKDYTPIKDERYENGYEDGYNACIDEIVRGSEENGINKC